MKKLCYQIFVIVALVLTFVIFDVGIYNVFTKRCINDYSDGLKAKSVELDEYLPFDENSKIVKVNSELKLTEDLPVIDGAAALYPVFSAFVNAVYPKTSCSFDGENFTPESVLQYTNTRGAYKAVVDGTADIVFCAYPSEDQLAYAKEQGAQLELVPIGYEAFVFIVNKENPVDSLTVEQVKGIYSGKYKNWSEVGGENTPIAALQRNEGSGSQTAMLSFMDGEEIKAKNSVFGRAIGFSFRFYVEGIVEDGNIKMLSLDGVYPNAENIRNKTYPIVSEFYAVYRKDNDNKNVPILIDWMLSEEGQKIIEESGYVGIK
ncbi:MAG: substrate-binding domain-containing protein [Oscillospiraceae bacterium]|nr:substrate-binding domain-containing protein [Oscillospiraceae bacterium]